MKFVRCTAVPSLSSLAVVVSLSILLTSTLVNVGRDQSTFRNNQLPVVLVAHGFSASDPIARGKHSSTRHLGRSGSISRIALEEKAPTATSPSAATATTDNNDVEFPPPLSPLQRTKRALEFYRKVLPVLGAYKAKEIEFSVRRTTPILDALTEEEEAQAWKDLDEWGSTRISETVQDMKGFYVKSGQVVATRVDLFPEAYTSKLQTLQDGLDPMPFELVEQVVKQELLDGASLSEWFATFEEEPLGSASIAQVHKATLLDGRTVAVKLQRPNVEPKLKGDVANLKRFSKALADALPIDYYSVFSELGKALGNELDFLQEAQAMRKIDFAVSHHPDGTASDTQPVNIPLPVGELVSKRVLVMDFVEGVPLNQLGETMKQKGIEPGSPEARLGGRKILEALTQAFERMIFAAGFVHGDPHPGNILVGPGGAVSLIDCGQFKAINREQRLQVAQVVLAVDDYQKALARGGNQTIDTEDAKNRLANLVLEFGVRVFEKDRGNKDLPAAIALLLFGDRQQDLPGGYSTNELSDKSPIKQIQSFPRELVLLGRAAVILKGIATKLDVPFSLAEAWGPGARAAIRSAEAPSLPLWGKDGELRGKNNETNDPTRKSLRFRHVASLFKKWGTQKGGRAAQRVVKKLPTKWRSKLLAFVVERRERKESLSRR